MTDRTDETDPPDHAPFYEDQPLVFGVEGMRALDSFLIGSVGIPGIVLMENAAIGCTDLALDMTDAAASEGPVLIFTGPGNNAGDGFAIARHLHARGIDVRIELVTDPAELKGDAATNFNACHNLRIPMATAQPIDESDSSDEMPNTSIVIDAILGTGARPVTDGPIANAVRTINELGTQGVQVLSVDVPTGLNAETGEPSEDTVLSTVTATFVGVKRGFMTLRAQLALGEVIVLDLGIPGSITRRFADDGPGTEPGRETDPSAKHEESKPFAQGLGPPHDPHAEE